jgi:glycosyltransferase involved in cell wall biosynthesis
MLVAGLQPAGFAKAILDVLALPDRGREMGVRARASVRERFHPTVIGQQLNAIYDAVAK